MYNCVFRKSERNPSFSHHKFIHALFHHKFGILFLISSEALTSVDILTVFDGVYSQFNYCTTLSSKMSNFDNFSLGSASNLTMSTMTGSIQPNEAQQSTGTHQSTESMSPESNQTNDSNDSDESTFSYPQIDNLINEVFVHLTAAKMWLGFELGRIRDGK